MTSFHEAAAEAADISKLIDKGIDAMRDEGLKLADAEMRYRQERAIAYAQAPRLSRGEYTSDQREADVDAAAAEMRHKRDTADIMYRTAREAVQARRQQLSYLQTLMNAHKAEADFARTAP